MDSREKKVFDHIKNFKEIDDIAISKHLKMDVFEVSAICERLIKKKLIKVNG